MARGRTTPIVLAFLGLLVIYVTGVVARYRFGIAVAIENKSSDTLRQVSVHVDPRGKQYPLPDLKPGETRRLYVDPHGESSINLSFTDASHGPHTEDLAGYVEDGYCGKATGTVLPDGTVAVQNDTFRMFYWRSWLEFVL